MRLPILGMLAAIAGFGAAAGPAAAMQCYTVLDRSDNIVYRGTIPPIDLSERGDPEREAMRRRGQHMIAMDADKCPGVEFFTGTAGSSNLSVDQIVGGITPMRGVSPTGNSPTTTSAPSARAPVAPSAPPTAPAKKSGY
jgi:hypothetical protein